MRNAPMKARRASARRVLSLETVADTPRQVYSLDSRVNQ